MTADIHESPYKQDFPLLAGHPEIAFLDSAATAQRPAAVLDAQRSFYETMNANPLRGLYSLSVAATEAIEDTRAAIAAHLGVAGADGSAGMAAKVRAGNQVVFGRNASEMLNLVAHGLARDHAGTALGGRPLGPGDEVVITIMEHHSNLIPWQQACAATGATLRYLFPEKDGTITPEQIEAAITPACRIVSCTHVSNVLGVETPIAAIAARAHEVGAVCVVDSAQGVPHLGVDVGQLGCDLLAFSAHKLGGPMGIGVLWGRPEVLDAMPPFLTGGEMIDSVTQTGAVWAPVPQKFEAGTQDAAGIYATGAALSYLHGIGMDVVEEREQALSAYLCERLQALPFVEVYGPAEPTRHVGAVPFNVDGIHPHDVASLLDSKNVCIRAGHHCAQPLLAWLGQESTCRASVAFYNDASDIDRLIEGLEFVWGIFHGNR